MNCDSATRIVLLIVLLAAAVLVYGSLNDRFDVAAIEAAMRDLGSFAPLT